MKTHGNEFAVAFSQVYRKALFSWLSISLSLVFKYHKLTLCHYKVVPGFTFLVLVFAVIFILSCCHCWIDLPLFIEKLGNGQTTSVEYYVLTLY